MEWQDISTVPGDCGEFLIFGREISYWEGVPFDKPRVFVCAYSYEDRGKRVFAATETQYDESTKVLATHWMPLPPPPLADAVEGV